MNSISNNIQHLMWYNFDKYGHGIMGIKQPQRRLLFKFILYHFLVMFDWINFILSFLDCNGFIVPIEFRRLSETILILPSILKGTDSRFGFGFHLNNHLNFQSILELGPQKFTKTLSMFPQYQITNNYINFIRVFV